MADKTVKARRKDRKTEQQPQSEGEPQSPPAVEYERDDWAHVDRLPIRLLEEFN
jgi:hypothetical protein